LSRRSQCAIEAGLSPVFPKSASEPQQFPENWGYIIPNFHFVLSSCPIVKIIENKEDYSGFDGKLGIVRAIEVVEVVLAWGASHFPATSP